MYDVTARVFEALQMLDITSLAGYPKNEVRAILPTLVRMCMLHPMDNTESCIKVRKPILAMIWCTEKVHNIVSYLNVNYLRAVKELKDLNLKDDYKWRQKLNMNESFDRIDAASKVHLVLYEILHLQTNCKISPHSEVFEDGIYLEEVVDIICIALAELPSHIDILKLTDAFIQLSHGHRIVCALVANFPFFYRDVFNHVINKCDENDKSIHGKQRIKLLVSLAELNPTQTLVNRSLCMDKLKMPSLMLKLALKQPEDLVAFLTGLLLGGDAKLRSWFVLYIRSSQKSNVDELNLVRMELLQKIMKISQISNAAELRVFNIQGPLLLRLYCALFGIGGLKFNKDEINALSQLVTTRPQATPAGVRFVTLAVCFLIACPLLVSTTLLKQKTLIWLKWLINEDAFFSQSLGSSNSLGEMLLLLALHFHNNQIKAVSEMVCLTLSMQLPIGQNSTYDIKKIFKEDLLTERLVAELAVRVPVTPSLSGITPGYLPVHCIHQLLKSRTFLKHNVSIKSWIFKQICNARRPLHLMMPALIEMFVSTIIISSSSGIRIRFDEAFTDLEILHVFRSSPLTNFSEVKSPELLQVEISCPLTSQILMIYYLMLYEDTAKPNQYTNSLLRRLPVKYLVQKAHQYHNDYISLFPSLLRLIISLYPHLSLIDDWLDYMVSSCESFSSNYNLEPKLLTIALNTVKVKPQLAVRVFKHLVQLPPESLAQYAPQLIQHLTHVFDKDVPRFVKDLYMDMWLRLNAVLPTNFWIMSLRAITNRSDSIFHQRTSVNGCLLEPMDVLACPRQIFCSPYMLNIMLRILKGSLASSKAYLNMEMHQKEVLDKKGIKQKDPKQEKLKETLIASQESAAVHILLEVLEFMERRSSENRVAMLELREIQGIIGTYVHQAFIQEPSLAKLVHYQTYPKSVIPMTVASVPSLHICLDFVKELLTVAEMDKQIFTLELTSQLVFSYSIPKSMGISKFCLKVIQTNLSLLTPYAKGKFLQSILPSMVRFVKTFPILADICFNILMTTGRSLHFQSSMSVTNMHSLTLYSPRDAQHHIAMIEDAYKSILEAVLLNTIY